MGVYDYLYDWQKNIVNTYKDKKAYGIYLDCGLGKTPTSLALAEVNGCNKLIVITINSKALEDVNTEGSWLWWINKSPMWKNTFTKKSKELTFGLYGNDALVINYESIFKRKKYEVRSKKDKQVELSDLLKSFIRSCSCSKIGIIIDESHKMKDLQSLQTKAIMKIKQECDMMSVNNTRIYLLSGTPFTTGYIDLYSQLKILGCKMNKTQFVDNFCIRGRVPGLLEWQQPIVGYRNVNSLYELVHKFGVTIKSDTVVNLPEKIFNVVTIPTSEDFNLFTAEEASGKRINKYAGNKIVEDKVAKVNNPYFRNIDYPNLDWIADTTGVFWMRSRQLSIGFQGNSDSFKWYNRERLDKLREILEEKPDNYIIFYNYTPELVAIFNLCESLGYKIDVYSGDIKSLTFYDKYKDLDTDGRINAEKSVLIANYASGGTGMNWQLYNKCIMFSLPLYKDWEQSLGRIHRIGQKHTVVYYKFVGNNWLDKSMDEALAKGIDYSSAMFASDLKRVKEEIL